MVGILVDRLRWLGAVLVCQHLKSGQFESMRTRSEQRQRDHQEAIHSANHHVEIFNLIQWVALLSQAENKTKDSLRICRDISYEHVDVQPLTRSMENYFFWMCWPWAGWPMERDGMKGIIWISNGSHSAKSTAFDFLIGIPEIRKTNKSKFIFIFLSYQHLMRPASSVRCPCHS